MSYSVIMTKQFNVDGVAFNLDVLKNAGETAYLFWSGSGGWQNTVCFNQIGKVWEGGNKQPKSWHDLIKTAAHILR